MSEEKIKTAPVVQPATELDEETRKSLLSQSDNEGQVIVHCSYYSMGESLRIWKTTFLTDRDSGHRSRLLHAENITFYPEWTEVPRGTTARFTLVFSKLPKGCKTFNLIEDIPQPGGFHIRNIQRNKEDVYRVRIE